MPILQGCQLVSDGRRGILRRGLAAGGKRRRSRAV